jgi:glycosyltransferase involved in cell wall biosynthesis
MSETRRHVRGCPDAKNAACLCLAIGGVPWPGMRAKNPERWAAELLAHNRRRTGLPPVPPRPAPSKPTPRPAPPLLTNPPPSLRLVLRAQHLTSWTGYGQIGVEVARAVAKLGIPVAVESPHVDERYFPLDAATKSRVVPDLSDTSPWRLQLGTPTMAPAPGKRSAYLTMWEVDRISPATAAALNASAGVIVPCRANAEWFRASGVEPARLRVVPMGVDPATYHPRPRIADGVFRIGAAGRLHHGGRRKSLGDVAGAFARAFPCPAFPDCRLALKCWEDDRTLLGDLPADPRIEVVTEPLDPAGMAAWLATLDVYASASRGEGWGLIDHQAAAVGRPIVATAWGARSDFWPGAAAGWVVPHTLEPAGDFYGGPHNPRWARPDLDAMAAAFRAAEADRAGCVARGAVAADHAGRLTWKRTALELVGALRAFGLLARPCRERVPLGIAPKARSGG